MRQRLARLFAGSGFRGPVLTLLSGTTATMALAYAAQPILTRLYTPEAFGAYDYVVMLLSVLTVAASLRYEDALMQPEDAEEARSLLSLCLLLTMATAGLLTLVLPWSAPLAKWLRVPEVAPWLWLVPGTLLLMRVSRLAELWLARGKHFRRIAAGDAAGKVTMTAGKVGLGLVPGLGPGGLLGGFSLAALATTLVYGFPLARAPRRLRHLLAPRQALQAVAARYRRFPLFSLPSAFLNALLTRLPTLLLPLFFDLAVVGYFGRAFVALAVPLSLVGGAVAQVFFVHAAEARRAGTLARLTATVYARLWMLGLFPCLLFVVAAPDLFAFVFGEPWRVAGHYEQLLALWFFLGGVAAPLTRLFDVLERQRTDLLVSLLMFVLQGAALLLAGRTGDVMTTLLWVGAAGAAARLLHLGVLLRLAEVTAAQAWQPVGRYLLPAVPLVAAVGAVMLLGRPWATTLAAAVAAALYYGLAAWREGLLSDR